MSESKNELQDKLVHEMEEALTESLVKYGVGLMKARQVLDSPKYDRCSDEEKLEITLEVVNKVSREAAQTIVKQSYKTCLVAMTQLHLAKEDDESM